MKKQRKEKTTIHLSSPTEGIGMRVYDDLQRVVYEKSPSEGHSTEYGSHALKDGLCQITGRDVGGKMSSPSHGMANGQGQRDTLRDQKILNDSMWMIDSSSQAYSGQEDNSTDPHETLTESSTLTFVDAHTIDESVESYSLLGLGAGVGLVHVKEFVLIDDDDDGDMSLREKTVTDMSTMDGNAAELVCGRLLSTSSGSMSECKGETPLPSPPPREEPQPPAKKRPCCFCSIL